MPAWPPIAQGGYSLQRRAAIPAGGSSEDATLQASVAQAVSSRSFPAARSQGSPRDLSMQSYRCGNSMLRKPAPYPAAASRAGGGKDTMWIRGAALEPSPAVRVAPMPTHCPAEPPPPQPSTHCRGRSSPQAGPPAASIVPKNAGASWPPSDTRPTAQQPLQGLCAIRAAAGHLRPHCRLRMQLNESA